MALINGLSEDVARQKAAIEDRLLNKFLDKHGLKNKSKEQLRLMGYELQRTHEIDTNGTVIGWTLWKHVDGITYRYNVDLNPKEEQVE